MADEFINQLQPGMKVGKYQIVSLVAAGGMSMLYKAYDKALDRYVAVKQIAPNLAADEKFVERFRREAQVLARISQGQQNVVAVYELVEEGGGLFMIMEFVEGTALQTLMDRGAASLQTGLGILLKVALGLKAIHSQGLVHRDLKPDNVMVQSSGGVKIADFGLIGRAGGRTSLPMGTTQYMAPEMFTGGTIDGRADIYSLGFLAFQMFVGPEKFREVFADVLADPQSANIRWMHWHCNPALRAPALREVQPGIPPLVARIVERMMEKDPGRRFASADQIIKWLRQIFVMYVQGKSLSEQDSARLEGEVDADIDGGPPARQAGGAPAAANGAAGVPATRQPGGAVAPKTAPLPKRPRHWQDYAKVGGIIAGVLILALIAWGIVDHYQSSSIEGRADALMGEGRRLFDERQFAEAAVRFDRVSTEFPELQAECQLARFWYLRAQAEQALVDADWDKADLYVKRLEEASETFTDRRTQDAAKDRVNEFKNRLGAKSKDFELVEGAKQEEARGNFVGAVNYHRERLKTNVAGDPEAVRREISRLEGLELQRQSRVKVAEAGQLMRDGKYDQARRLYAEAASLYESPEVQTGMKALATLDAIEKLKAQIQQEATPSAKTMLYDRILDLGKELDEDLRRLIGFESISMKAKQEKADSLFEEAMALQAQGKFDEAAEKLGEALELNPSHQEAAKALNDIDAMRSYADLKQQYDKALKDGDIEKALRLLDAMIAKQTSPDIRKELIEEKKKLQVSYLMRRSEEARRARRWDEAVALLQEAEGAGADRRQVEGRLRRVNTERNYFTLMDKARELLKQQQFDDALKAANEAANHMNSHEIKELIKDITYEKYKWQGNEARKDKKYPEARGYYKLAQGVKDTPEIRKLIEELETLINRGP